MKHLSVEVSILLFISFYFHFLYFECSSFLVCVCVCDYYLMLMYGSITMMCFSSSLVILLVLETTFYSQYIYSSSFRVAICMVYSFSILLCSICLCLNLMCFSSRLLQNLLYPVLSSVPFYQRHCPFIFNVIIDVVGFITVNFYLSPLCQIFIPPLFLSCVKKISVCSGDYHMPPNFSQLQSTSLKCNS